MAQSIIASPADDIEIAETITLHSYDCYKQIIEDNGGEIA